MSSPVGSIRHAQVFAFDADTKWMEGNSFRSLHRLRCETRMVMVVMMVVVMMHDHHDLRLCRNRDCGEAEDENQSEQ